MKRKLTALLLAMTFVFATVAPTVANGSAKASANKTATVSVEKSKKEKNKFGAFIAKLLPGNKDKAEKETKVAGARKALKAPGISQEDARGDEEENETFVIYFGVRNKDGAYLDGARLIVVNEKDRSNPIVWSSGKKPSMLSLAAGNYKFLQEVPARGYKSGDPIDFTITAEGKVEGPAKNLEKFKGKDMLVKDMLVIEAEQLDGKIFYGIVDHSGKRVAGAKIQIKEKDSEEASYEWTSNEGFKDYELLPGDYLLLQSEAPEGYEKADPIEFTIDKDRKISTKSDRLKSSDSNNDQYLLLEAKEAKKETGKLFFSLRDMAGKELSGAKLKIVKITEKDADKETEELVKEWTSGNESVPYKLEKGKYKFVVEGLPDDCAVEKVPSTLRSTRKVKSKSPRPIKGMWKPKMATKPCLWSPNAWAIESTSVWKIATARRCPVWN